MAWDDEMVAIVRGMMQDYGDPRTGTLPAYADDNLSTMILIAGQQVQGRITLPRQYSISITNGSISPDPTSKATRDDPFINLSTLRTACLLANAEVRKYTGQGISVRDGSSAVSLQRSPASLALMQKVYCEEFEDAVFVYQTTGVVEGLGEAVVGPIKAWYWGGGMRDQPGYGLYWGPGRIGGRGDAVGVGWYGPGGCCPNPLSGGNWGN